MLALAGRTLAVEPAVGSAGCRGDGIARTFARAKRRWAKISSSGDHGWRVAGTRSLHAAATAGNAGRLVAGGLAGGIVRGTGRLPAYAASGNGDGRQRQ